MENDFLLFSYFGIYDEEYKTLFVKIGERAYLDFCRTIRSKVFKTTDNAVKADLKKKAIHEINRATTELETSVAKLSDKSAKRIFNEVHKSCCDKIRDIYSEVGGLSYGQAQKWVNMTLKYLMMLNDMGVTDRAAKLRPYLHVPVDNYTIEASKELNAHYGLGLTDVPTGVWSQWEYDDYNHFQNSVRLAIEKRKSLPPECKTLYGWECIAWLEVAKRHRIIDTSKED